VDKSHQKNKSTKLKNFGMVSSQPLKDVLGEKGFLKDGYKPKKRKFRSRINGLY